MEVLPGLSSPLPGLSPAPRLVLKPITITPMVLLYQSSEITVTLKAGWTAIPGSDTLLKLTIQSSHSTSSQTLMGAPSNWNTSSWWQCTEWQTEPALAAAPATVVENPYASVAALIKFPVSGPRAGAATMIINTSALVAFGLTPMNMADTGNNSGVIMAVTRARKASRWVIVIVMTMNRNTHFEEPIF